MRQQGGAVFPSGIMADSIAPLGFAVLCSLSITFNGGFCMEVFNHSHDSDVSSSSALKKSRDLIQSYAQFKCGCNSCGCFVFNSSRCSIISNELCEEEKPNMFVTKSMAWTLLSLNETRVTFIRHVRIKLECTTHVNVYVYIFSFSMLDHADVTKSTGRIQGRAVHPCASHKEWQRGRGHLGILSLFRVHVVVVRVREERSARKVCQVQQRRRTILGNLQLRQSDGGGGDPLCRVCACVYTTLRSVSMVRIRSERQMFENMRASMPKKSKKMAWTANTIDMAFWTSSCTRPLHSVAVIKSSI